MLLTLEVCMSKMSQQKVTKWVKIVPTFWFHYKNNKQMLSCLICNINQLGMGKNKMCSFKVFDHPQQVFISNNKFDFTIVLTRTLRC